MKIIQDPKQLKEAMELAEVSRYFSTPNLVFTLVCYERGECLVSPFLHSEDIQILIRGRVRIYYIREDGSRYILSESAGSLLMGDIQLMQPDDLSPLYAEAETEAVCLKLSGALYREKLMNDLSFLRQLSTGLSAKLLELTRTVSDSPSLKDRVRNYMQYYCKDFTLKGIERTALTLHCSERQLRRILNQMAAEGEIVKCGRGCYQLNYC